MKIAAIMMVRNEANIIADSLGHLLHGVGVDLLLVADNGSSDATPAILGRLARQDPRLQVVDAPGPCPQPEVMTDLLHRATAQGADWVLPADADEFLWTRGRSLRALCAEGPAAGYSMEVRNFVQFRHVRHDRPGRIETMLFSVRPRGTVVEGQGLVEDTAVPFLRTRYPHKVLLRTRPGLALHRGSHAADGLPEPLVSLPAGELLHAPMRAHDGLRGRAEHGRLVQAVDPAPGVCWHLKRLVGMAPEAVEAEWQANSVGLGRVAMLSGLRLDLRLSRLGRRQRRFRQAAVAGLHAAASRRAG